MCGETRTPSGDNALGLQPRSFTQFGYAHIEYTRQDLNLGMTTCKAVAFGRTWRRVQTFVSTIAGTDAAWHWVRSIDFSATAPTITHDVPF